MIFFETLIKKSAVVIIDISTVTENLLLELKLIADNNKREKSLYIISFKNKKKGVLTRFLKKEERKDRDMFIKSLERDGIIFSGNIIDLPYLRSKFEYLKEKRIMKERVLNILEEGFKGY